MDGVWSDTVFPIKFIDDFENILFSLLTVRLYFSTVFMIFEDLHHALDF